MLSRTRRSAIAIAIATVPLGLLSLSSFDCSPKTREFGAGPAEDAGQTSSGGNEHSGSPEGGASGEAGAAAEGGDSGSGNGGANNQPECTTLTDCPKTGSDCLSISCVDGACAQTPLGELSPCTGGACDATGSCVASTCESKQKDGDETGLDCGGSCDTCANGGGCIKGTDCTSGVCLNQICQPSGCTDGVKNGTETDVDCGGTCSNKCALNKGCAALADCAIAAGDSAENVRCLQQTCTSTKPPGSGIRFYQDFNPARLVKDAAQCGALDDTCLRANGSTYPMYGLDTSGTAKALLKASLYTVGAVGSGGKFDGKFDGKFCLTRTATNLSFNDASAFSAMAWVKSTRASSPYEGAVVGAPNHYLIMVDSNPSARGFMAALSTTQQPQFTLESPNSTGQVPNDEWHHLALVYDTAATTMTQYLDGAKLQSVVRTGTVTTGAADVLIGCRKDTKLSSFFLGTIDEVVLYTRALTAAEVSDYARRTKP